MPGFDPLHFWFGYFLAGLLFFRVVWGFVSPNPYARFASFAYAPRVMIGHLLDIFRGHPKRYLGHSPAGSGYIYIILSLLVLTALTGFIAQGYYEYEGPLWALGVEPPHALARWCLHLHEPIVDVMLVFIAGHLAGVITAMVQHKENLVLAMLTGYKNAQGGSA
ncbi:MAG: cytochrome B [Zetaproteobacteria bacterium]|nr:MAG: cytochrome B [Zetaproteobacteria bacterium]